MKISRLMTMTLVARMSPIMEAWPYGIAKMDCTSLYQIICTCISSTISFQKCLSKTAIPKFLPCPDLASQLLQILILTTFNSLLCQLHISHVKEDGLLGKYFVITTQKSKRIILHRNFCLSKKEVFMKLPVQKTCKTGPG